MLGRHVLQGMKSMVRIQRTNHRFERREAGGEEIAAFQFFKNQANSMSLHESSQSGLD